MDDDALLDAALDRRLRGGRRSTTTRRLPRLYRYLVGQGFETASASSAVAPEARRRPES